MERHEWLLRENEIEKLQNLRIELLEKMLKENELHQQNTSTERINRQWAKKQVQREDFVKKNRLHYLRGRDNSLLTLSHRFRFDFIQLFDRFFVNVHNSKLNMSNKTSFKTTANTNRMPTVH